MESLNSQVSQQQPNEMGFIEKLIGIFVNPVKVFKDIKNNPKILMPFIFVSILTIIVAYISMPLTELTQEKLSMLTLERYGVDLMQEQDTSGAISRWSILLAPVGVLVGWLIGSFFLWIMCKILRGKANMKQVLSLNIHVMMLTTIGTLIAAPFGLFLNTDVSVFSLAILFPNGTMESFGYNMLYTLNLLGIWGTIITAMGLAVINEFSNTKGYIASIIIYVLSILLAAASLTSTFWMYDFMQNQGML